MLGGPNPDVFTLYVGLLADVDQTARDFVVHDPKRPDDYSRLTYS